jgi:coenzyme PQQ synthesis protein D (PqqD)
MRKAGRGQTPRARKSGLVIKRLADEVLVYDQETHKAHCLNPSSALVWNYCDGRKTAREIARLLSSEAGAVFDEEVIWLALEQLERFSLLEEPVEPPRDINRFSRREIGRRLGLASISALPFIVSIVAPVAAVAATCFPLGTTCTVNAQCCSGLCFGSQCACLGKDSSCTSDAQCCSNRCGSANNKCLP